MRLSTEMCKETNPISLSLLEETTPQNCGCVNPKIKRKSSNSVHQHNYHLHNQIKTVFMVYIALFVFLLMSVSASSIPDSLSGQLEKEEGKIEGRSLHLSDFFRSFFQLPAHGGPKMENENSDSNNQSDLLMEILKNVRVDRKSLYPVQFYNADFERGNDTDDNSTEVPQVIFGSPLCLGLCLNGQFYAENTSVRLLSDKQYSLFGPKPGNDSKSKGHHPDPADVSTIIPIQIAPVSTDENEMTSVLTWLSSWMYDVPLAPAIRVSHRIRDRLAQLSQYNPIG